MDILSRNPGHGAIGLQNHPVGIGISRDSGGAQGRLLFFRDARSGHRIAQIFTLVGEQSRFRLHDIGDIFTPQNKLVVTNWQAARTKIAAIAPTCDFAQQDPACRQAAHGEFDDPIESLNSLVVRFPTTRTMTMMRM